MSPVLSFPLADEIIASFSAELAGDDAAYRNHVCRELNFFLALTGLASPPVAIEVAAAFHDLGIWTHRTLDYLPPSAALAGAYLSDRGLAELEPEVRTIINEHHKILPYAGPYSPSAEAFRKADLVDLSFGAIRFGLPREFIRAVRTAFPNSGFHKRLCLLAARQLVRTPLRPLPMFHW